MKVRSSVAGLAVAAMLACGTAIPNAGAASNSPVPYNFAAGFAADHLAVIYDSIALRDVLNALEPAHSVPPRCTPVAPVLGG